MNTIGPPCILISAKQQQGTKNENSFLSFIEENFEQKLTYRLGDKKHKTLGLFCIVSA